MNGDVFGFRDHAVGTAAGQCSIVAALVVALDENGIVPRQQFCDALRRLWVEMPEEQAMGAAGEIVERVLDLISSPSGSREQDCQGKLEQGISAVAGVPAGDDDTARPGAQPSNTALDAVRRFG